MVDLLVLYIFIDKYGTSRSTISKSLISVAEFSSLGLQAFLRVAYHPNLAQHFLFGRNALHNFEMTLTVQKYVFGVSQVFYSSIPRLFTFVVYHSQSSDEKVHTLAVDYLAWQIFGLRNHAIIGRFPFSSSVLQGQSPLRAHLCIYKRILRVNAHSFGRF